jgi:hypothetical protein
VRSIASLSKLFKLKKNNKTADLYDDDELAKAWRKERAQKKRREKARTPSPDTTEESSDCSSEGDATKSLDEIVGDAETVLKTISCEETCEETEQTLQTASDEETEETEETDETDEEEETDEETEEDEDDDETFVVADKKKTAAAGEKTAAYAPTGLPGLYCGCVDWICANELPSVLSK